MVDMEILHATWAMVEEILECVTTPRRTGKSRQVSCRHLRVYHNSSLFFTLSNTSGTLVGTRNSTTNGIL